MAVVLFNQVENKRTEVTIHNGHTILRAAKQGRVVLKHKCGGKASCTTCKVEIKDQANISPPLPIEEMRLGEENIKNGYRLSCQTKVYGKVEVKMPEDPFKARIRELLKQQEK